MTYDLTEEQKKRLTEFLEECWHMRQRYESGGNWCIDCGSGSPDTDGRTFDTPQDQHDLFTMLVKKGKWGRFYYWAIKREFNLNLGSSEATAALFDPARFCWLVAKFLEGTMTNKEKDYALWTHLAETGEEHDEKIRKAEELGIKTNACAACDETLAMMLKIHDFIFEECFVHCPKNWGDNRRCDARGTLYYKWGMEKDITRRKELALQIAEMEWKEA